MAGPRSGRLIGAVLRCYPARWRTRHGEEAAELAELLIRDGASPGSIMWSYLLGAARERATAPAGRRLRAAVSAATLLAGVVGVTLALLVSPGPASAASAIRLDITRPSRAAAQLAAQLRSHGLRIAVVAEPVSPSLAGSIVRTVIPAGGGQILARIRRRCPGGAPGCEYGLVLPAHFTGRGYLVVGRAARPGQRYAAAAGIFRPGELLHCSGLLGATVRRALPVLAGLDLKITWRVAGRPAGDGAVPPGAFRVTGGHALSPGAAVLLAAPRRSQTSGSSGASPC